MPQRLLKRSLLSALALSLLIFALLSAVSLRPAPTPLGAELIRHKKLPSIAYGVHTSVWWNETARARDFEYVRLMRFATPSKSSAGAIFSRLSPSRRTGPSPTTWWQRQIIAASS